MIIPVSAWKDENPTPEMVAERKACIAILVAKAAELGRLPKKADLPGQAPRIKRALGPWGRALEAAALKTRRPITRSQKNKKAKRRQKAKVRQYGRTLTEIRAAKAAKAAQKAKTAGTAGTGD
jgi:hypothetical protein